VLIVVLVPGPKQTQSLPLSSTGREGLLTLVVFLCFLQKFLQSDKVVRCDLYRACAKLIDGFCCGESEIAAAMEDAGRQMGFNYGETIQNSAELCAGSRCPLLFAPEDIIANVTILSFRM